jgi:hypothetical protein
MAMRTVWIGTAVMAVLVAGPTFAQTPAPGAKLTQVAPPGNSVDAPDLALGEDVAIACEAIERVADPSDVRVVLTIAAVPGDTSPGYKKLLAVDEKVTGSAVHLKVPSAPDLENHTVNLSVYVVDGAHHNDCDGGQYHIVQTPPKPAATHG